MAQPLSPGGVTLGLINGYSVKNSNTGGFDEDLAASLQQQELDDGACGLFTGSCCSLKHEAFQ
jgi:hypothetical protein